MRDIICDYQTAVGILDKAKECSSMLELCGNHGVSIREFELALLKHKLPFPEFYTPLERKIEETYQDYKKGGWSNDKLAKHYGVSGSTLRYYLLKLGLIATPRRSADEIEDIAYFIKTRGGSVVAALDALGSRIPPRKARQLLLAYGFDYISYEHAWKRYGNWEVQPARPRKGTTKGVLLYVRCLDCGVYEWRPIGALVRGDTLRCNSCARRFPFRTRVRDNLTGEVFPNSTTASEVVGKRIGVSYQAIQYGLRRDGTYKREGCDLEALDLEGSDYYKFVPDVFDDIVIGSRLMVRPFPNDDLKVGEPVNRDGLLVLAQAAQQSK